jgi:putative endonuclease
VLKSLRDGKYYYGHTANVKLRLDQHNRKKVKSTKSRVPFVLHCFEEFETKSEAAKRELFFKSINGFIFLKEKNII